MLDLTANTAQQIAARFPKIYSTCVAYGIDPANEPIPVSPAEHYMMGGIRTDLNGATNVRGLLACGECACTGVHGANRLASNSMLEGLVFGIRTVEAAMQLRETSPQHDLPQHDLQGWANSGPHAPTVPASDDEITAARDRLHETMWHRAGLVREWRGPAGRAGDTGGPASELWPTRPYPPGDRTGQYDYRRHTGRARRSRTHRKPWRALSHSTTLTATTPNGNTMCCCAS